MIGVAKARGPPTLCAYPRSLAPRSSATNTTTSGRFAPVVAVVVVLQPGSSVAPSATAARVANRWIQRGDGVLEEAFV